MDVETLNKIEELVKDANKVYTFRPESEPAHVYYLKDGDGVEMKHADPAVINHTAATLETLADKAADEVEENGEGGQTAAQIWVDRSGVVLLLDDNRRDKVTYPLALSDQINGLNQVKATAFTQKDLIFLLRTTFRDCLGLAGDLIPILRTIKFRDNLSGESTVGHGKSSIGKQLLTEITGTQNLPEYVTLSVPVFAQAGVQEVRSVVECALEPDAATQTFRLIPLPGQIERAIGDGEHQVAAKLHGLLDERTANQVGVFRGKP